MSEPLPSADPDSKKPSWQTAGKLLGALFVCLGLLWILQWQGCGAQERKAEPPVMSSYYYQLVAHVRRMGPAVYQATGDQGKPDSQPLVSWLAKAQSLTRSLGKDRQSSDACRQAARQTEAQLVQLISKTKGRDAYQTGYQAWKQVNDMLLKCQKG